MEYHAANSLGNIPPLSSIGKPVSNTVDTIALSGLLLARSQRCGEAVMILDKALKAVQSHYGITSMQYIIVVAEMADCYKMLRDESQAEKWARTALDARQSSPELLDRPDRFCLLLALADSLTGRGKYLEALPLLQDVVENRQASDTIRMISVLRLVKSRRRLHQEARAFERNSPLLVGLPLLNRVSAKFKRSISKSWLVTSRSSVSRRQRRPEIRKRLSRLSRLSIECWTIAYPCRLPTLQGWYGTGKFNTSTSTMPLRTG
jgi:hypothetical protein